MQNKAMESNHFLIISNVDWVIIDCYRTYPFWSLIIHKTVIQCVVYNFAYFKDSQIQFESMGAVTTFAMKN